MKSQMLLAAAFALVSLALAPTHALASKLETRWMPLQAKVSVGADGRVTDVVLVESEVSSTVKSIVVNNLKRWQFVPVLANGVAVPALTYVDFSACAIPSGDGYDLAIHYVDNGPLLVSAEELAFQPSVDEYSKKHQSIMVKFTAKADGHAQLQDAVMVDVSPLVQREVRSSIRDWVGSMRFKPEQIGGKPVATDMQWPIELTLLPIGMRYPNVDVASDPACKAATSANNKLRSANSPLKLRENAKADDEKSPAQ